MRCVIIHPKFGVYLGNCLGLGFWTLLDTAGQSEAVTFENDADARDYIAGWDSNNSPDDYSFVAVCSQRFASVSDLLEAGLGDRLGDMALNTPVDAWALQKLS